MIATLLSTLGTAGVSIGQGSSQLLAASAFPLEARLGPLPSAGPSTDRAPIVGFDRAPEAPRDTETSRCETPMRMSGAIVAERPEDSFAAMVDGAGRSLLYQAGMSIDEQEVVSIESERVIVRRPSGSLCAIPMGSSVRPSEPSTAHMSASTERSAAERGVAINQEGMIDSARLGELLADPSRAPSEAKRSEVSRRTGGSGGVPPPEASALGRLARVRFQSENGPGATLYGIRRSSALAQLGLRNGDTLRAVNGYAISSADAALDAYAALQNARHITIELDRRGQAMRLEYDIR